jgi:hypothetical protein
MSCYLSFLENVKIKIQWKFFFSSIAPLSFLYQLDLALLHGPFRKLNLKLEHVELGLM